MENCAYSLWIVDESNPSKPKIICTLTTDTGKNVGSGTYFYKLIINNNQIIKKNMLLK